LMAALDQPVHQVGADEVRTADDQDSHDASLANRLGLPSRLVPAAGIAAGRCLDDSDPTEGSPVVTPRPATGSIVNRYIVSGIVAGLVVRLEFLECSARVFVPKVSRAPWTGACLPARNSSSGACPRRRRASSGIPCASKSRGSK